MDDINYPKRAMGSDQREIDKSQSRRNCFNGWVRWKHSWKDELN